MTTDKQMAALRMLCDLSDGRDWVSVHIIDIELGHALAGGRGAGALLSALVRARPALAEKRPGRQVCRRWELTAYRPTAEGVRVARGRA